MFKKEELSKPVVKRTVLNITDLESIEIDYTNRIINEYRSILEKICVIGENENSYGEVAKLDVANILACNERVVPLGKEVASYKTTNNEDILKSKNKEELHNKMVNIKREKEVVNNVTILAEKLGIRNPIAVGEFVQKLIDIVNDVEIEYAMHMKKKLEGKK